MIGPDVDLLDAEVARRTVAEAQPDIVYHLAALASAGRSWEDPARTLRENEALTLNVLEAVRSEAPGGRLLAISSGEVYGRPEVLPADEATSLRPQNPYAVSKASGDLLAGFYADGHGLDVIRVRPFNHAGPGQSDTYAIASFARQVAEGIASGAAQVRVVTGNPDSRRDFTDVRDVVRAYRLLAAGAPAGVYNVCSGRSVSVTEIVALLGEVSHVEVVHEIDQARVRAHDVPEIVGSHAALTAATGWEPQIPLATTLADTVAWWTQELTAARVDSDRKPE